MQNIFIELLPPWVETGLQPAFYDKESGTVLQQVSRMYAKINQLIGSVNNQNKTIADYIQKFIDLKDYVDTYFNNLDVQTEINNKLDQMASSGQLVNIISQYLQAQAIFGFDTIAEMSASENLANGAICKVLGKTNYQTGDGGFYKIRTATTGDVVDGVNIVKITHDSTLIAELITDYTFDKLEEYVKTNTAQIYNTVADMKSATNLIAGSYARTLGYYALNDGGAGLYKIRTITDSDVVDEASIVNIGDSSNQLIAELIYVDSINLEQFGCYGDNTHDDTTNLQKAVTFAETHKLVLTSKGDKTYKVTSPINVDTLECDLNMATVTTPNSINIFYINSENYYGMITGITFDCTNANSAIYINNGRKKTIKNIIIKDLTSYGIYFNKGYELLIDECHINGKSTATNGIGIYMKSSDSKVSNVILIDCHTAIRNDGMNFFEYIHAWIRTPALVSGSVMFYIGDNKSSYYSQCYSDTYYITYDMHAGNIQTDQMQVFFNQNIYSSGENAPYFIYYADGANQRSSVTNSDINGVRSNQKITFSNKIGHTKTSNNNLVWVNDGSYYGGIKYEPTTTDAKITEIKTNKCVVKNGVMYINLLFVMNTSQGGTFSFANLPMELRPMSPINTAIFYGDDQWTQSGLGYLFIKDNISGQVPTSGNETKYVKVVCSYAIENENY